MTAIRPITIAGDRVFELNARDLTDPVALEHVAASVEVGDLVYCPSADTTAAATVEPRVLTTPVTWWHEPPPPVKPAKLDRPERLQSLGWFLRKRGLVLLPAGAFYYAVALEQPEPVTTSAAGSVSPGARP